MLQIFIIALMALGIIGSPDEASQELINQNEAEIQQYIIDTDYDQF